MRKRPSVLLSSFAIAFTLQAGSFLAFSGPAAATVLSGGIGPDLTLSENPVLQVQHHHHHGGYYRPAPRYHHHGGYYYRPRHHHHGGYSYHHRPRHHHHY